MYIYIYITQKIFCFKNIFIYIFFPDPNMPSESFAAFYIRGKALPADLSAQVSAKYTSTTGVYINGVE